MHSKARAFLTAVLASMIMALLAQGQNPAKRSREAETLNVILKQGVQTGGLRHRKHPQTKEYYYEVADAAKLRAVFAANHKLLTPALRDALIKFWEAVETYEEPAIVAMLTAYGQEMKDDRALAYAAFYTGIAEHRQRRAMVAVQTFKEAARHFKASKDAAMQATCLHQIGLVYRAMGEDGLSLQSYLQALDIRRKIFPKNHRLIATTLNNIGVAYASQGQFAKALDHHEQALAIRRELYGAKDHPDTAWSLRNIAYVLFRQGQYREALKWETESLDMRRRYYKKPHPQVADSLHGVGVLLNELGDFAKALEHHEQALEMWGKLGAAGGLEAAEVRFDRAIVYAKQGRYTEALREQEQVLALRQQFFKDRRHPSIAASLAAIGNIHLDTGAYADALKAHEEALQLDRQFFGEIHDKVASSWNNVAVAKKALGEYVLALEYHHKALVIWKKVVTRPHPSVGYCLDNLAQVHAHLGNYTEAERYQKQALKIFLEVFSADHPAVATSLNGLGFTYTRAEKYPEALQAYQQALEISAKFKDRLHQRAISLYNLAVVYQHMQDQPQALKHYQQARKLARQVFGSAHPMPAQLAARIGWLHFQKEEFTQALAEMDEALRCLVRPSAEKMPLAQLKLKDLNILPTTIMVLAGRARVLEKAVGASASAAQLRECAHHYQLAALAARQLRQGPVEELASKLLLGENTFDLYPRWIGVCQRLYALEGKAEDLHMAFRAAELGTARLFVEDLSRSHAYARKNRTEGFHAKVGQILAQLKRCRELIAQENAKPLTQRSADRVGFLMEERQRWDDKLHELMSGKDDPQSRAKEFLFPEPCSLVQARAGLRTNEVILLYVLGQEASYLLLIEDASVVGAGMTIHRLPAAEVIEDVVDALTDGETLRLSARVKTLGTGAFDMLLGPIAGRLENKDLLIVPSGALCYLPFELLVKPDREGKSAYLVEKHGIRYAPSVSIVPLLQQWQKERDKPGRGLWAVGDPVYQASDERLQGRGDLDLASKKAVQQYLNLMPGGKSDAALGFARLQFSGREIEKLRELFGQDAEIFTGLQATTAALKAGSRSGKLAQARYLHFATHGVLGLDAGRQPSLVLSLAGNEKGDGFLPLDEVTDLKLNADLVVLSACQTGKGRLYNGEGVRGLARAFLHAGSKGVVCSLWSVDDEETAGLMVDLYRHLRKGRPAAAALREAQLAMIQSGKPPLYWAPFVVIGE